MYAPVMTVDDSCDMHEEPYQRPGEFIIRPTGPRTYKAHRQRARLRFGADNKSQFGRRIGQEMDAAAAEDIVEPVRDALIDRTSLCLPNFDSGTIIHGGEAGYADVLRQYFPSAESNASERLVSLKSRLREASTLDFWSILIEEMCEIAGAQCGFVAKRMLVDDQDSAVEMPELGEPGSCLMGVAFYINGNGVKETYRDYRYHAYGTPCAHMRHDKVFIVPERMTEFVPNNPNTLPWKHSEAFIGVPLFAEGKCFAHFGMVWSTDGASKRKLGWSFIEMFMHSLEDMILQRILEGRAFTKEAPTPDSTAAKVIPLSAITPSQSLQPYARSLSHELRTPMQGVVGMLDIMYSTVLDAIANQPSEKVREVFQDLRDNIEIVQDSSRRAVEAADNVVHAYDYNMQMPETPLTPSDTNMPRTSAPQSPMMGMEILSPPAHKKRARSEEVDFHGGPPLKRMFTMTNAETIRAFRADEDNMNRPIETLTETIISAMATSQENSPVLASGMLSPAHRRLAVREFMRSLVNEVLKNGHPTSEIHRDTALGEIIEVQTIGSRGETQERIIDLEIESDVPDVVVTEEQHLGFALQKVVDNAIKFTEHGRITINVKINKMSHFIEISVTDTGCGISLESQTNLFKPHFQEDASISRPRDGLGLSLFNAKAHVRKNLGGDVTLERSETDGPAKGSEFLIRLPISSVEAGSEAPLVGTTPPHTMHTPRPSTSTSSVPSPTLPPIPLSTSSSFSTTDTKPSPSHTRQKSSSKHIPTNPSLAASYPLSILIAEDNAINRNVFIGALKKLGYKKENITVAFDGAEAVAQYKASLEQGRKFDVVMMDIWMPNMDGYEATKRILELEEQYGRTSGKEGKMRVLAVTADITDDCHTRAKAVGMHGFLTKPYKVFDIERLIIEHFERR